MDKYDIVKDRWTTLPDLNEARKSHSSCNMLEQRMVYVFGGYNQNGLLSSIERLNWSDAEIIDRNGVNQASWRTIEIDDEDEVL